MPNYDSSKSKPPRKSVKEYMQGFISDTAVKVKDAAVDKTMELSSKAIAAQILEMKAIAKSIKKKERDALLGENFLKTVRLQEKLANQLIDGQKMTKAQQVGLEDTLKTFYTAVDGYSVSSDALVKNFNTIINKDLPDVIKKRLTNDARKIEKRGEKSDDGKINVVSSSGDKEGSLGPFKTLKDMKALLSKVYASSEGFRGWMKSSWETMSYFIGNAFRGLMDKLTSSELWEDLLKLGLILGGSLLTGLFKTGQLAPILDSLKLTLEILWDFCKSLWGIVSSIDWKGKVLDPAQRFFAAIMNAILTITEQLAPPLLKVFDLIFNGIADMTGALLDAVTEVIAPTTDAFNMLMKVILDLAANIIPPLVATFEDVTACISEVWNMLMESLTELEPEFKLFGDILGTLFSILGRGVRIISKLLVPVIGILLKGIVWLIKKAFTPLLDVIKLAAKGFDMLFGVIEGFLDKIPGFNKRKDKGSSTGDQAREWDYSERGAQGTQASYSLSTPSVTLGSFSAEDTGGAFPKYKFSPATQSASSLSSGSMGDRLASTSEKIVNGRRSPGGWCLKNVADAMDKAGFGPVTRQPSAYMFAPFLARNSKFTEASVAPKDLAKLPRGAVVVWGKGTTPHGHISIADGKGNELSDYVGRQRVTQARRDGKAYGPPRVFIPRDVNQGKGGDIASTTDDIGNSDIFEMLTMMSGAMIKNLISNVAPPELIQIASGVTSTANEIKSTQASATQLGLGKFLKSVLPTEITSAAQSVKDAFSVGNIPTSARTPDEITSKSVQEAAGGKVVLPKIVPPAAKAIQAGRKKEIDDSDLMILQSIIFS